MSMAEDFGSRRAERDSRRSELRRLRESFWLELVMRLDCPGSSAGWMLSSLTRCCCCWLEHFASSVVILVGGVGHWCQVQPIRNGSDKMAHLALHPRLVAAP